MEEDIKILKEFVKYYEEEAISRKFRGTLSISVDEDDIQAIENILNRLEQDERVINKAIEILGEHRHYSWPTEEQAQENEEIVDKAYELLKDRKCG